MRYDERMSHIRELTCHIKHASHADMELITKAYHYAERAHESPKRASGEPYFNHVFATAKYLAELNMSPTVIAAGLLHDVIEDTGATPEEIEAIFGKEVLFLVQSVTKLGTVKYKGVERNVENLRKFFVSMAEDLRVIVIKLADRLHNVETLQYVKPEKQRRIALETLEIYAPLASRLGIGELKGRLEDAAFPFAYPKEHAETKKLLETRTDAHEKYLHEIDGKLKKVLKENHVNVERVDHRVKHLYSLWKKLKRHDMDIEKVYDIIALRIIVKTTMDCWNAVGVIHSNWTALPGRIKDYLSTPKPNGYQSLHTTIFTGTGGIVEVQIRTPEMHEQAEYGIAAHFAYKEARALGHAVASRKEFAWIDELRKAQDELTKSNAFLERLKTDYFKDRVFIFTPIGEIMDLPEDSSAVDFAFAVHTDIGMHASGAKINGKFMPMTTKLKTNDIVEIQINPTAVPTSKWYDAAKTTNAKIKIQKYLKEHSLISKWLSFGKK